MDGAKAESKRKQKTQKCLVCKQEKSIRAFRQRPANFGGVIIDKYCKVCVGHAIKKQIEKNQKSHNRVQKRNSPSKRKNWGNQMFNILNLSEREY